MRDHYVLCKKDTTLSVRRQVMQNHFSSASHSLSSICTHSLGFFRSIQSNPALPLHPTWVTPTLQGSEGGREIQNNREDGRQTEGQLKESGLNRREKRGYVNKQYELCRKFHVISVFHTISKVCAIYRSKCVFFYSPMDCRGGNAEFLSLSQSVQLRENRAEISSSAHP